MENINEEKYLLAAIISVRYWELVGTSSHKTEEYLRDTLKSITPKENIVDDGLTRTNILNLIRLSYDLLDTKTEFSKSLFKQSVRIGIKDDEELYQSIVQATDDNLSKEEVDEFCRSSLFRISEYIKRREFFNEVKKVAGDLLYKTRDKNKTNKDIADLVIETTARLEKYTHLGKSGQGMGIKNPIVISGFSTSDPDSIAEVWKKGQIASSSSGIIHTGYQGINKALGVPQGFFRGDTVVVGALQHRYKSGMMADLSVDIPAFNTPCCYDEKKIGAVVHISLENAASDDLFRMYKRLFAREHGRLPTWEELEKTDPIEVASYLDAQLGQNGFKHFYMKLNPNDIGYVDIQNIVMEIESQGFEIHVLIIDYLATLSTKGIPNKGDNTEYQELFRIMRNFCSEHDICLITPHQLSTEATYLNRDGAGHDFVKLVAGNSYWAKSKQIDREVDVEIIQHIVNQPKYDGSTDSYLTICVGKNRRVHDTKPEDKHCAIPFTELGLVADYGGTPNFVKISSIRGNPSEGDSPDW